MDRQCQSILYCMVVILSQWSLQGSFAVFMCTRRQCGRRSSIGNRSVCAFYNARKQRSASETAAWSSCRAVILGIVEMQRRWSAHTSASGWPFSICPVVDRNLENVQLKQISIAAHCGCLDIWHGPRDLAPSRCGRRIVVMLWSPSVHLPASVTDCHDPLDMDGSIICLLISSTGVLDSYIARLVSCVSMELDNLFNFIKSLDTDCVSNSLGETALGKGRVDEQMVKLQEWTEVALCGIGVEDAARVKKSTIIALSIFAGLNCFPTTNAQKGQVEIFKLQSTIFAKIQPASQQSVRSA
ncbi:Spectrin beta chain,non-erythrocytic [Trichinella pseudospiralis]